MMKSKSGFAEHFLARDLKFIIARIDSDTVRYYFYLRLSLVILRQANNHLIDQITNCDDINNAGELNRLYVFLFDPKYYLQRI